MKTGNQKVINAGREFVASTTDGYTFTISTVANCYSTITLDDGVVVGREAPVNVTSTLSKTTKSVEQMTPMERLTEVLYLALTAPTDKLASDASKLADRYAIGLSDSEVEACKNAALSRSFVRGLKACATARRG